MHCICTYAVSVNAKNGGTPTLLKSFGLTREDPFAGTLERCDQKVKRHGQIFKSNGTWRKLIDEMKKLHPFQIPFRLKHRKCTANETSPERCCPTFCRKRLEPHS